MARLANAHNNPEYIVSVFRAGGPRQGTWQYVIYGAGPRVCASGEYRCRYGGTYRDTLAAARRDVADLLGVSYATLYHRWTGGLPYARPSRAE